MVLPVLSISCNVVAEEVVMIGGDMTAESLAASAAVPAARRGLRKGKAPAAAAQAAIPPPESILGTFIGENDDIPTADRSKGDSGFGDFFERFNPSLKAASSSAAFRFLRFESTSSPLSGDLRAAVNCWCV